METYNPFDWKYRPRILVNYIYSIILFYNYMINN